MRHLVLVDDGFLRTVRDRDRPVYRHGVPHTPGRALFASVIDLDADPPADEVLAARTARMAEVREFLADVGELQRMARKAPGDYSGFDMPVLSCFWRMVNEEREHHSFALRDLEVLENQ